MRENLGFFSKLDNNVFFLFGRAVNWMSKRQSTIALSIKTEYIVVTYAAKEVIRMHRMYKELGFTQGEVKIVCDNQSAIFLVKNPSFHATKHINIQYHLIREKMEQKVVILEKVDTHANSVDFFT